MAEKDHAQNSPTEKNFLKSLFTGRNRGILLDVVVFLLNLFLMRYLTKAFLGIFQSASDGDLLAQVAMLLFCIAIFILPPAGATLKRWHFHQRLKSAGRKSARPEEMLTGCLFNPIFFFCLNVVIYSAINSLAFQLLAGGNIEKHGGIFVSSILFGMVLIILQTFFVYRYFSPPKTPPEEFLQSSQSENLGDVCFYLNMILFQILWNMMAMIPFGRVSGGLDLGGRIFFLSFVALLIYFPPRIFYLAEDMRRPRAWLTILLANSPVILRVLLGTDSNANW